MLYRVLQVIKSKINDWNSVSYSAKITLFYKQINHRVILSPSIKFVATGLSNLIWSTQNNES